ncbi:host attachment family protein [Phenylobacterium sp. J367]|uniref:host attachment family protein n=1 Tax=Phenylobacterium sp. J367 TaxID=2898435 RepID=UPI002150BCD9|nr:host attachment family protein [Phenylobacterium sp. J367]MCR5881057.1 host attachment family protein [Phenylobacterium sp. J367]
MINEGVTWIVAADGGHVRVFEERRRAGDVRELADLAMRISESDRRPSHAHTATVHERAGYGRHAGEQTKPEQAAEERFLARAVETLHAAAQRRAFDRLAIMAPPTALGEIRRRLTAPLVARLDVTDPHNRTLDDAEAIREHLREARARG